MAESFSGKGSNIAGAEWDEGTMIVTFADGGRYRYFNVPLETFSGFEASSSHGQFFHRNIKGRFNHDKF